MNNLASKEYPIEAYALIGNCETAALINPDGGIDWLCLPAFDAEPLFAALLDRDKGGEFSIRPASSYRVRREYLDDSAIFQTRFVAAEGTVRLTDFFVIARRDGARFYDFTALQPTRKLVRLLQWESGRAVPMEFRLEARSGYGRDAVAWTRHPADPGQFLCPAASLRSNLPLGGAGGAVLSQRFLAEPDRVYCAVLDYGAAPVPAGSAEVERWLAITKSYWREWNLFNYYRGPHEKMIRRSAVTLKLLTYAPTGAFVAAPTTSLPERLGGEQNWDYRYLWVRDTSLFINAMFRLGYSGEAKAFVDFMRQRCQAGFETGNGGEAQKALDVLYPIRPGTALDERRIDHLRGYRNSTPVRIGNRAARQFQMDNYGHLLEAFHYFRHTGGKTDRTTLRLLARMAEDVASHWQEPENGIWEDPTPRHYSFSKVMAWTALERAAALVPEQSERWKAIAASIREEILSRALGQAKGESFLADAYDSNGIDAACLLAFTGGFLPENLAASTRRQVEGQLVSGPFVYRNLRQRHELREGAFVLCSFWWIGHLIREGELARAEKILCDVLAHASPLGLLAEEIDPHTGEFLGNFPQAFSHLGLITAVLDLEEAKKTPGFHRLPDSRKFAASVGATIGVKAVLSGFVRVPATLQLLYSQRSKWR